MATIKQIEKKVATFTTNRDKLKDLGQEIGMMIIRHAAPKALPDCDGTGDVTMVLKFAEQLPKSWEAQFDEWLRRYTPIRYNLKNKKCGYDQAYKKLDQAEKIAAWDIEGANLNPFYTMTEPEVASKTYDFKALVAMVERLGKQIEKKIERGDVLEKDIPSAQNIATVIGGLSFKRIVVEEPKNDDKSNDDKPEAEKTGGEFEVELKNVA